MDQDKPKNTMRYILSALGIIVVLYLDHLRCIHYGTYNSRLSGLLEKIYAGNPLAIGALFLIILAVSTYYYKNKHTSLSKEEEEHLNTLGDEIRARRESSLYLSPNYTGMFHRVLFPFHCFCWVSK